MQPIRTISTVLFAAICAGTLLASAQTKDPRVADLVATGRIRVGFGYGGVQSATKDLSTGEIRGPSIDLGRALAAKIGVEFVPVGYTRSGSVLDGARTGDWDVAFLVLDPAREAEADFSPPFMQTDFTYLAAPGSKITSASEADRPGIRIALPSGDASELLLSRIITHAELIRTPSIGSAIEMLRAGTADLYAGLRPNAIDEALRLPGSRVLADRFGVIHRAALVPKDHRERLSYITDFVEEAKASGLIKAIIARYALEGIEVSPPLVPEAFPQRPIDR